jgi:uncharacterized protein
MEILKVGDVRECTIIGLDPDRRRISLSLKSDAASRKGENGSAGKTATVNPGMPDSTGAAKRIVRPVRTGGGNNQVAKNDRRQDTRGQRERATSDDGMSYNPFAALLKNKK